LLLILQNVMKHFVTKWNQNLQIKRDELFNLFIMESLCMDSLLTWIAMGACFIFISCFLA
jgi:hypothetical protein